MSAQGQSELEVRDLGFGPYGEVLDLQERLVADRAANRMPDTLLLVEHEPVYTLGRSAHESNVLASAETLRKAGIQVVRTSRGGDVTYHGPGQLVGYPILDLRSRGEGVSWYVRSLEEVLIRVLAGYGIEGARDPKHRGVWVGTDKIAALGVRVTRGISMHGFALNVHVDLDRFGGIVPCGIRGRGVTSMNKFVDGLTLEAVKPGVISHFRSVFGYDLEDAQSK